MKILKIVPFGWPCKLKECPPGPFLTLDHPDFLCFKTEYQHSNGSVIAYNSAGENFQGDDDLTVQPVDMLVEED